MGAVREIGDAGQSQRARQPPRPCRGLQRPDCSGSGIAGGWRRTLQQRLCAPRRSGHHRHRRGRGRRGIDSAPVGLGRLSPRAWRRRRLPGDHARWACGERGPAAVCRPPRPADLAARSLFPAQGHARTAVDAAVLSPGDAAAADAADLYPGDVAGNEALLLPLPTEFPCSLRRSCGRSPESARGSNAGPGSTISRSAWSRSA